MAKNGIPKHRIAHCMGHLDYLPEILINEFPDKNVIFKVIKLSRDYIETVMMEKPNCKPLIDAVTKLAVNTKKALKADTAEDKKLATMIVNRLTAIAKRWGKMEAPVVAANGGPLSTDVDEVSDEEEEQEQ